MPTDSFLRLHDYPGIHNPRRNPIEASNIQTILLQVSRFGDFLPSTVSWWRIIRISTSEALVGTTR
jgi:hypothetical protein